MRKGAAVFSVLGLFSRSKYGDELELLPPPPPFPDFDVPQSSAPLRKIKTKIVVKHPKQSVDDVLSQASSPKERDGAQGPYESIASLSEPHEEHWNMDLSPSSDEPYGDFGDVEKEINGAIDEAKQQEQKPGFWKRFFMPRRKEHKVQSEARQDPFMEDGASPLQQANEAKSTTENVMGMVNGARQLVMDLELEKAKGVYVEVMKSYRMMTEEEQKQVYEPIRELYEERKAAESLHLK